MGDTFFVKEAVFRSHAVEHTICCRGAGTSTHRIEADAAGLFPPAMWYGLADEALEDALYDSHALQGFARINLAADGNARSLEKANNGLFVATSGFADHMGVGMVSEEFNELCVGLGIIGQGMGFAGQVEFQRELGNIKAGVEDGSVVLTHTCRYEPRRQDTAVLMQRFELRTMSAGGTCYGTHHAQAYAWSEHSHPAPPPSRLQAGGRRHLGCLLKTNQVGQRGDTRGGMGLASRVRGFDAASETHRLSTSHGIGIEGSGFDAQNPRRGKTILPRLQFHIGGGARAANRLTSQRDVRHHERNSTQARQIATGLDDTLAKLRPGKPPRSP